MGGQADPEIDERSVLELQRDALGYKNFLIHRGAPSRSDA